MKCTYPENNETGAVVVVKSERRLKAFLRKGTVRSGYFVRASQCSPAMTALLSEYSVTPVVSIAGCSDHEEKILSDYIEAVGRLGEWNGHIPQWWMTDIASKNAYRSPLLPPLYELVHTLDAIRVACSAGKPLFVIDPSWPAIMAIKNVCRRERYSLVILSQVGSRALAKLHGGLKTWVEMFRSAAGTLRDIVTARRYYGKHDDAVRGTEPTYLIKSFVYPDSFRNDGEYLDPFFGGLADYLAKNLAGRARVMTVSLGFALKRYCYEKMKSVKGAIVIPFESVLGYMDVVRGLWQVSAVRVFRRFRVKDRVDFLGVDIAGLLRELLASGGWRIPFYQYLYRAAGKRLAKKHNVVACVLTNENNPWERAFMTGIRENDPNTRILGYQHSVIPQAAANMFPSKREMSKIPCPDLVLTTGVVPAAILTKYGAFPKERIVVSCALRYNYLAQAPPQPRHRPDSRGKPRILVALCGVVETLSLYTYVIDQADNNTNVEFLIRPHPALPLEDLRALAGGVRNLPSNITISTNSAVMDDIVACDAVLYWGSSVALEGIRLGKPAIHFDPHDILSYDPLFALKDFKWVVSPESDLMALFDRIQSMPDVEFNEQLDSARRYVIAYHNPVSAELLAPFLNFRVNSVSQL